MMMIVLILEVRKWGQTAYLTRLGGGEVWPQSRALHQPLSKVPNTLRSLGK